MSYKEPQFANFEISKSQLADSNDTAAIFLKAKDAYELRYQHPGLIFH